MFDHDLNVLLAIFFVISAILVLSLGGGADNLPDAPVSKSDHVPPAPSAAKEPVADEAPAHRTPATNHIGHGVHTSDHAGSASASNTVPATAAVLHEISEPLPEHAEEATVSITRSAVHGPMQAGQHVAGPVEGELIDITLKPLDGRPSPIAPTSSRAHALPDRMQPDIAAERSGLLVPSAHRPSAPLPPPLKPSLAATLPPVAPQAETPAPQHVMPPEPHRPSPAVGLLSTSRRNTRRIGEVAHEEFVAFEPPLTARPRTPSIWSKTFAWPASSPMVADGIEIINSTPSIRAPRQSVRAERRRGHNRGKLAIGNS